MGKGATSPGKREPAFWGLVTASHGRHFEVTDERGNVFHAHPRGKRSDAAVGDLAGCSAPEGGVTAIETVSPRRNFFCRSDEWRTKTLAANVDLVAVLFASRPAFNPRFVWKAAIAAASSGTELLAVRTKCATDSRPAGDDPAAVFACSLAETGIPVASISSIEDPDGSAAALAPFLSGKTTLLVGQSGMGKSTLLNLLCPEARARTREYSEALNSGRQTTTATRLYTAVIGGKESRIIDSPGFQAFGLAHVTLAEVLAAMPDIARHAAGCRYYNCTHSGEPGCSVRQAADAGKISPERYAFYCEMASERK